MVDRGTDVVGVGADTLEIRRLIGSRVRLYRVMAGISQERLGEAIGVTFQQVQKYERGGNRIASDRLYAIARVLRRDISDFFEGLEEGGDWPVLPCDSRSARLMKYFNAADGRGKAAIFRVAQGEAGCGEEEDE